MKKFPSKVKVICADGSDSDVIDEEGLKNYDACVALTGIDEENYYVSKCLLKN